MKEQLIAILQTFGYPIFLQGSLAENEAYPQNFFTIWNNDSTDQNHYDNNAIAFVWDFDVNFYSTDPTLVNTVLLQVKKLLKQNRWIVGGKGYDVASDEPTHTGRGINAQYLELNKEE